MSDVISFDWMFVPMSLKVPIDKSELEFELRQRLRTAILRNDLPQLEWLLSSPNLRLSALMDRRPVKSSGFGVESTLSLEQLVILRGSIEAAAMFIERRRTLFSVDDFDSTKLDGSNQPLTYTEKQLIRDNQVAAVEKIHFLRHFFGFSLPQAQLREAYENSLIRQAVAGAFVRAPSELESLLSETRRQRSLGRAM